LFSARFTGGGVPSTARDAALTTLVALNFLSFFFFGTIAIKPLKIYVCHSQPIALTTAIAKDNIGKTARPGRFNVRIRFVTFILLLFSSCFGFGQLQVTVSPVCHLAAPRP
jgi:hypothetical protein